MVSSSLAGWPPLEFLRKEKMAAKKKKLKKPGAKSTSYGLSGNTGVISDPAGKMVMHLNMPYGNNDENTVFVGNLSEGSWERMSK